jgi:hypothetical protein
LEVLGALGSGGIYLLRSVPSLKQVKQDLIDNEILESVPKTMKAKVQLLLKKMKSSPDISLNENNVTFVIQTISSTNYFDSSREYNENA